MSRAESAFVNSWCPLWCFSEYFIISDGWTDSALADRRMIRRKNLATDAADRKIVKLPVVPQGHCISKVSLTQKKAMFFQRQNRQPCRCTFLRQELQYPAADAGISGQTFSLLSLFEYAMLPGAVPGLGSHQANC